MLNINKGLHIKCITNLRLSSGKMKIKGTVAVTAVLLMGSLLKYRNSVQSLNAFLWAKF